MPIALRICCWLLAFAQIPKGGAWVVEPIGVEVKLEDYPFVVSVLHRKLNDDIDRRVKSACGGAYIKPSWVLSIALCLRNFSVGLTANVADDGIECKMGLKNGDAQSTKVAPGIRSKKVLTHPDFKWDMMTSELEVNVGLVLLEKPFDLSPTIGTVQMATGPVDYVGKKVTIVGYSRIFEQASIQLEVPPDFTALRMLSATVWPKDKCRKQFNCPDHLCIGVPGGHVPWAYELGGPLLLNNKVIALAAPDTSLNEQVMEFAPYQDILPFRDWIDNALAGKLLERKKVSACQQHRAIPVVYLNLAVVYLIKFM